MSAEGLYRAVLLDHHRHPRGRGALDAPTHEATAKNPLCGDLVNVQVRMEDGRLAEVGFTGEGCALSLASASLLTGAVCGLAPGEARARVAELRTLLQEEGPVSEAADWRALAATREHPARVRCALLPWEALERALA